MIDDHLCLERGMRTCLDLDHEYRVCAKLVWKHMLVVYAYAVLTLDYSFEVKFLVTEMYLRCPKATQEIHRLVASRLHRYVYTYICLELRKGVYVSVNLVKQPYLIVYALCRMHTTTTKALIPK